MAQGIYLDHAATTPPAPAVLAEMVRVARLGVGNPASLHARGLAAARALESARARIAGALGASPDEVVFTSGGTEANNLAIQGSARVRGRRGGHLIVSAVEHPSVLGPARLLAREGFRLTVLPVDRAGRVAPEAVRRALRRDTFLVCVMHANNEVGTIQPIAEIGRLCRERGVLFHTDACQSFTKVPLDARRDRFDLAAVNGHKLHGPRGAGCLFVRKGVRLSPLFAGGGQEGGLRPGTPPVEALAGFARAVALASPARVARLERLRDLFIARVRGHCPRVRLNGPRRGRLCGNISLSFPGLSGKALVRRLSEAGVYVSTGSACASRRLEPSHVLTAMGLSRAAALSTVRVSLGWGTTPDELARAARALCGAVRAEEAGDA